MDVAVVGTGIHGLSVARRVAEKGHQVVVFDPFPVALGRNSSYGPSRIVRRAYPDAYHTGLMTEAYPLWRELEAASDRTLFHETGMVCFGPVDGPYVAGLSDALGRQSVPFEPLSRSRVDELMPGLQLSSDEGAVFVPDAGWVEASLAQHATFHLAKAAGVEFVPTRAEGLDRFDRVAICAGAWVRKFWPEAPVRITLQATAFALANLPQRVWIEDGPDLLYGMPAHGGGVKIGVHRSGQEVDPDEVDRRPPPEMIEAIGSFVKRRFGIDAHIFGATPCLYTVTADERFLFHRLDEKTLVVSACSGHGFKFGPWIGVKVAEMLVG